MEPLHFLSPLSSVRNLSATSPQLTITLGAIAAISSRIKESQFSASNATWRAWARIFFAGELIPGTGILM